MENDLQTSQKYNLEFHGKGETYFGIIIVNWLLTIITLGLYYPWAKAKKLQFIYGQTTLNGDAFAFHGTGNEMFKGFIKVVLGYAVLAAIVGLFTYLGIQWLGFILVYLAIFAILPLAIHGSHKYRMSRTSWRGIRFGYRGDLKEFSIDFFKWLGLTLVTFGIYGSWMAMSIRQYIVGKTRFGNAEFKYQGDGGDYFIMNIKGYFLTIFTLGIYLFWWQKDIFEYYINNLSLHKDKEEIEFESTVTGGGLFKLIVINVLIIIFTLGFGYAWAETRSLKYIMNNIKLEGNLNLDNLNQTEADYKDATGDDLFDALDLDFVM